MFAARNAQAVYLNLSQKAFYSDLPGKCAAIALHMTMLEVLPRVKALFPVQFEPPWCRPDYHTLILRSLTPMCGGRSCLRTGCRIWRPFPHHARRFAAPGSLKGFSDEKEGFSFDC